MLFNHTHSAILRGRWLIDKTWADAHMPLVFRMIHGEKVDFGNGTKAFEKDDDDEEQEARRAPVKVPMGAHAGSVYNVSPYTNLSLLPDSSIAMVTIEGPLLKRGDYCSYGMVDQAQLITRLSNSPNVSGIILNTDSPGGQADGTALFADAIKNAATVKPIICAIDDGIAASAAMWIASACSEIYVTQPTDQVGSVGVYTQVADWAGHYRDFYKLSVTEIYAPQSTEKNKDYRDAIAGDISGVQEDLSVLADQFINTVAANRAGKIKGDKWKAGGMFYTKDAEKIGLIDGQKNMSQVITRMNKLINSRTKNSNSNTMAFERTLTAAKAESFAVTDDGFLLSEDNLNNVNAELVRLDVAEAALTAANLQVTSLNAGAAISAATILTQETRIQGLETKVTELGGKPSGAGSSIITEKDENAEEKNSGKVGLNSPDHPLNQYAAAVIASKKKNQVKK